jgi:hypothetical protein
MAYRLRNVPNTGGMDPVSLLLARYLQGEQALSVDFWRSLGATTRSMQAQ